MISLRRSITASAALLALAAAASTALGSGTTQGKIGSQSGRQIDIRQHVTARQQVQQSTSIGHDALAYYGREISRFRKETWRWERLMGARLTPARDRSLAELSPTAVQRAATQWRQRLATAHARALHPPHLNELLCIHRYEGSWTDTGAPYYGGLQMDVGFQQSYGGWLYAAKGTADHWSPIEQIWVAENALKSRGFGPWPNTARSCGLL